MLALLIYTSLLSHSVGRLNTVVHIVFGLSAAVYWWRYNIRLENLGQEQVQLRERHWKIYSLTGRLETVKGKGVIGQEPILSLSQPAFQYSSHVSLRCPSGHMWWVLNTIIILPILLCVYVAYYIQHTYL